MADSYPFSGSDVHGSAVRGFAITPNDTVELANIPRAIYVGGSGNLVVRLRDDSANVTFAVLAGQILSIRPKLVLTSSTATLLVGLL